MGLRATVVRKYEVEYGDTNGFNYDPAILSNIIGEYCDDFYSGDDGCGGYSTDAIWEVDKAQFREMVDELRAMDKAEFDERMREDWFDGVFSDDKPYTKKYILEVFGGFLWETPANSDYVRIGWL